MFRLVDSIIPECFMFFFWSPLFKNQYQPFIGGTTSPHLNIGDIKGFQYPLISIPEQKEIIRLVNKHLGAIESLHKEIGRSLTRAARLRQSILEHAFQGNLRLIEN